MDKTFQWIPVELITVPANRQRQQFDQSKLDELAESIRSEGLINPISLEAVEEGRFRLIAGERRLRAMKQLLEKKLPIKYGVEENNRDYIPASVYHDLTDVQRSAIELKENIVRADLTWQERDKAIAAYHNALAPDGQLQRETAADINATRSVVANALITAQHLDDPEIAAAKDRGTALKLIAKKEAARQRAVLAKDFKNVETPHDIRLGDACQLLLTLPNNKYSVIITDPPYGIDADKFGTQAGVAHDYVDSKENAEKLLRAIAKHGWDVCKRDAVAYIFCDFAWFEPLSMIMTFEGWKVWPRPIIWDKVNRGMVPDPERGPRNSYECILYARKGELPLQRKAAPDVISCPAVRGLEHGAQKPVQVYTDLLSRVILPGDHILDPCLGSGTAIVAANRLSLICTGFECGETSYNLALSRINDKEIVNESDAVNPSDDIEL